MIENSILAPTPSPVCQWVQFLFINSAFAFHDSKYSVKSPHRTFKGVNRLEWVSRKYIKNWLYISCHPLTSIKPWPDRGQLTVDNRPPSMLYAFLFSVCLNLKQGFYVQHDRIYDILDHYPLVFMYNWYCFQQIPPQMMISSINHIFFSYKHKIWYLPCVVETTLSRGEQNKWLLIACLVLPSLVHC